MKTLTITYDLKAERELAEAIDSRLAALDDEATRLRNARNALSTCPPRQAAQERAIGGLGRAVGAHSSRGHIPTVVKYIDRHPGSQAKDIIAATKISGGVVYNLLGRLSKSGALVKSDTRPSTYTVAAT